MSFDARFLLLPAAAIVMVQPAVAGELQSMQDAQQRLVQGSKLTPFEFRLSPEQHAQLKEAYQVPSLRPLVRGWRTDQGATLFLDQVYGRDDVVTYLVLVGEDGKVRGLEVLTCAEGYCDVFTTEWRARLTGVTHGRWKPEDVVPIVSGSTLSTVHIAEGVKKVLAIHARYMPQPG